MNFLGISPALVQADAQPASLLLCRRNSAGTQLLQPSVCRSAPNSPGSSLGTATHKGSSGGQLLEGNYNQWLLPKSGGTVLGHGFAE